MDLIFLRHLNVAFLYARSFARFDLEKLQKNR